MNRHEFIETFNTYFKNLPASRISTESFREFDLDVTEYTNPEMHLNGLKNIFKDFFEHIEQGSLIDAKWFKDLVFHKDYDSYFEEDNPDSDICRFNMGINLHYLYDNLALKINKDIKLVDIYRIETVDGKTGLYGSGIAKDLFDEHRQPSPLDDSQLKEVFNNSLKNENYKRNWSFAFDTIDDVKAWMETDDLHSLLEKTNLCLKKITVPECYVISGDKQTIFQKQYMVTEEVCELAPAKLKMKM